MPVNSPTLESARSRRSACVTRPRSVPSARVRTGSGAARAAKSEAERRQNAKASLFMAGDIIP